MGEEGLTLKEDQKIHEEKPDKMESVKEIIISLTPVMVPTTIAFKNEKKIKRASGLRLEHIMLSMVRD